MMMQVQEHNDAGTQPRSCSILGLHAGLIVLLFLFVFASQSRPLQGSNEGRYTAVALELLRTGDPLRLQLSDGMPHFTKPPLLQTCIAVSVSIFGRHEWVARLPNSMAYLFTCALLWALARLFDRNRAWLAPGIYASFALPFVAALVITTDTLLAFWEVAAVASFIVGRFDFPDKRNSSFPYILMWAAMGAGFLTKGPPSLLPLGAILLFEVVSRDWRGLRAIVLSPGLLLFVIIGLFWYVLTAWANPGLLQFWLQHEVLARVTGSRALHGNGISAIFTVSLATLLAGTLPWTWVYIRQAGKIPSYLRSGKWKSIVRENHFGLFLFIWFAFPATVFILVPNRQPLFLLPVFAPLALIAARSLGRIRLRVWVFVFLILWSAVLLTVRAVGNRFPSKPDSDCRRLAACFQQAVPAARSISFVDYNAPWYGLRWYLDVPVRNINWVPVPHSHFYDPQTSLEQELSGDVQGVCFVVKTFDRSRFMQAVSRSGGIAQQYGECGGNLLLKVALRP